jgi:methionyl-tRNA synthetase
MMMLDNMQNALSNPNVFLPLIAWALLWKGLALWRAARLQQIGWYIALLIINTVGIFEIIYLIATNKKYKERNSYVR